MYFLGAISSKALSSLEISLFSCVFGDNGGGGINTSSSPHPIISVLFYFLVNSIMKKFCPTLTIFPSIIFVIQILFIYYLYILK